MTKDEALRLALEALGWTDEWRPQGLKEEAITAIKEALANEALDKMAENARELGLDYEPEQPKVRTGNCLRVGICASEGHKIASQRTWVGLTDEELEASKPTRSNDAVVWELAVEWAEAKLKEKNT